MKAWTRILVTSFVVSFGLLHCGSDPSEGPKLSKEELMKPETCATCHAEHVKEWSGSMHAYAAEDPVFLAMNARLQRESGNALGTFCVQCHAPMAVALKTTTDGMNLAALPAEQKGVTCYFCHNVAEVLGTHNNPLVLAMDRTMRGGIANPAKSSAHDSSYSALHDRDQLPSSAMCGSCHDIVTPGGAHIERTYAEWQASVFNRSKGATCSQCHMAGSSSLVPVATPPDNPSIPVRTRHAHTFAGVDVAVTPFPEREAQAAAVQAFLDKSLQTAVCVSSLGGGSQYRVILDNVGAGHSFPSGSVPDRRVWVELVAERGGVPIFESGVVPEGGIVGPSAADPNLWLMRDHVYDASGAEVHQFGAATRCESSLLPFQVTSDRLDPRFYRGNIVQRYPRSGAQFLSGVPDKVRVRVRILPVGLDVIDDLIASGDLAPELRSQFTPRDVGAAVEWTPDTANLSYSEAGFPFRCVTTTNVNVTADKFPPEEKVACPAPPAR